MRRILATATLGLALFGAAACADTKPEASGTPTPGAATSAAAPTGVDKATACANLTKAAGDFKTQGAAILPEMMNPATQQAAVPKLTKLLTDFQTAYSKDVNAIADPELKAAVEADLKSLQTAAAAVVAANGDAAKIEAALTSPEFTTAGEKVTSLCKA